MNFDCSAPLHRSAIEVSFGFKRELPEIGKDESLTHLYLHWSASGYQGAFSDYNAIVSLSGNAWVCAVQTSPRLNATEPPQLGYAAHTYRRNGKAFGLCVDAMDGATPSHFGSEPITLEEIETLCACAAVVCQAYNIDASDPKLTMTHGEAAILDGYFVTDQTIDGVTRWDLARLTASNAPLSKSECVQTGNLLRERIHRYKLNLIHG